MTRVAPTDFAVVGVETPKLEVSAHFLGSINLLTHSDLARTIASLGKEGKKACLVFFWGLQQSLPPRNQPFGSIQNPGAESLEGDLF